MSELKTPWLRDALIEHLGTLRDVNWLALDDAGGPAQDMDEVLDFFDDTGIADAPEGRIGYALHDEQEAMAMAAFGRVLDAALDAGDWRQVPSAAVSALTELRP